MDATALLRLLLPAASLALVLGGWAWARSRHRDARGRVAALTALTLFLTFDLIVFGSFTRLTDSGLGCPDWPGCYGHASPIGAADHIREAQQAQPTGPVTFPKAWIEMIHRYLAMTVGALIVAITVASVVWRRSLPLTPAWAAATLAWVVVQGLFGMYTVTWKLAPAIVTAHLLGGMALLGLLAAQHAWLSPPVTPPSAAPARVAKAPLLVAGALLVVQIALGAWVSSNYAVLACSGFPTCNGQWWPAMDFGHGFTLARDLGRSADGDFLPFEALVAIHWTHRAVAVVAGAALLGLAWQARRAAPRFAATVAVLTGLQIATGVSNVVLGWPLAAALLHVAGAAGLVALIVHRLARSGRSTAAPGPAT